VAAGDVYRSRPVAAIGRATRGEPFPAARAAGNPAICSRLAHVPPAVRARGSCLEVASQSPRTRPLASINAFAQGRQIRHGMVDVRWRPVGST